MRILTSFVTSLMVSHKLLICQLNSATQPLTTDQQCMHCGCTKTFYYKKYTSGARWVRQISCYTTFWLLFSISG